MHTFVIRKTRSRRPFRPLPIQFSDLPRLYSQQLSKKVMPFCCVIEVLKGGAYELSLTYEIRVDLEKRVTSLKWTWSMANSDRMAVEVRIFHNQVAPWR